MTLFYRFLIIVVATSLLITIYWRNDIIDIIQKSAHKKILSINDSKLSRFDSNLSRFAVMIQTEQCLPPHLNTDAYYGNSTKCACHVYVLSYRKPCKRKGGAHISYIFDSSVGWSGGRNRAFSVARANGTNYLYYIFMDDDIHLEHNFIAPMELRNLPPFQMFIKFLLEYEPAGACTDYVNSNKVRFMLRGWHSQCAKYHVPIAFPIKHADPCFNAFHRNTADIVLPYNEEFDDRSFWVSGLQLSFTFQLAFFGQYLYYPFIRATNPKHRYNKVGYVQDIGTRKRIVQSIKSRSPLKYRNHSVFNFMLGFKIFSSSYLWCKEPFPPKSPIVPYRWMHNFTERDK